MKDSHSQFASGAIATIPVVIGYTAIGIPFGILGVKTGVPVWALVLMSIMVFAGSAQFVALEILSTGAGITAAVAAGGVWLYSKAKN